MKSWLEISEARLAANFRAVQAAAGKDFEVLAVIKADAYGHDGAIVAPALCRAGARWLGVADVEEGTRLRHVLADAGLSDVKLLVMSGMEVADAPEVVRNRLCPVVWRIEQVLALQEAARNAGDAAVEVQIEVDTGMNRQGIRPHALRWLLDQCLQRGVTVAGIMSHLCCSEMHDCDRTVDQETSFAEAWDAVGQSGVRPVYWHLGNTSAVDEGSTVPVTRQQANDLGARPMVRTGLALFGYTLPLEGGGHPRLEPHLHSVATWKTRVIGFRTVAPGAMVGYGATFIAERPMRLALLPVGYWDGLRRGASSGLGNGWVMIGGRRAAVVGRVSMNLTVVDATDLEAAIGDEVVLLGEGVTAHDHARWNGTIAYEILCGLRTRSVLV